MARRQRNDNPVSLFPFLAVLMCTMGALIFLLIVVSKNIKENAIAKRSAEIDAVELSHPKITPVEIPMAVLGQPAPFPADELPKPIVLENELPTPMTPGNTAQAKPEQPNRSNQPPVPTFDDVQAQLAALSAKQIDLAKQLKSKQTSDARLAAELKKLNDEATRLKAKAVSAEQEFQFDLDEMKVAQLELENSKKDRDRLIRLINDSKELVKVKQLENAKAESEHVIVPYDGDTGTTRRPIILDCTDESIRLVGEGIEITARELVGFTPTVNPLKNGVRELVRFWLEQRGRSYKSDEEPVPYIMIIVRPSGTVAFYVVRRFLQDLKADIGYELVAEDFKFSVEPTPAEAVQLCRAAIVQTLEMGRPEAIAGALQGNGSFTDSLDVKSRLDRIRSGTGTRGAVGNSRSPADSFSALNGGTGKSATKWDSRQFARRGNRGSRSFFSSDNFRNRSNSGIGSGQAGLRTGLRPLKPFDSSSPPADVGPPSVGQTQPGVGQARRADQGVSSQVTNKPFNRNSSRPTRTNRLEGVPTNNNSRSGNEEQQQSTRAGSGPRSQGARSEVEDEEQNGAGGLGQRPASSRDSRPARDLGNGAERNGGENDNRSNDRSGTASSGNRLQIGSNPANSLTPPKMLGRINSGNSPSIDSLTSRAEMARSGSRASSARRQQNSGTPQSPGDADANSSAVAELNRRASSPPRIRALKRQWGIKNPNGVIALEKEITIRLSEKRVVIGNQFQIRITEDRTADQISNWTIQAIDRVATKWGPPPDRFYWSPAVTLVIEGSGDLLSEKMRRRFRENGISVEVQN